jgi:5-methylcytosine-specific restriction enzyme A
MIRSTAKRLKDILQGKAGLKDKRSDQWPNVRKSFLKRFTTCAVCNGKDKLEVHHIQPFHLHPELELSDDNLITLCESGKHGVTCHLFIGHLGNYMNINPDVVTDSHIWYIKLKSIFK